MNSVKLISGRCMNAIPLITLAFTLAIAMGLVACSDSGGNTVAAVQSPAAEKIEGAERMDHLPDRSSSAYLAAGPSEKMAAIVVSQNMFNALDSDHDGFLTATEAQIKEGMIEHWDRLDTDDNRQLDVIEFSKIEQ